MNAQDIQVQKEARDHVQFVLALACELQETNQHACQALHLIVRTIGMEEARKLLQVVMKLEETGGLMTMDGSRRRTIGGVYLWCAKQKYRDQLPTAFWKNNKTSRSKKEEQPVLPPLTLPVTCTKPVIARKKQQQALRPTRRSEAALSMR